MQCSSGFSARGGGQLPAPLWLRHWSRVCNRQKLRKTQHILLIINELSLIMDWGYHPVTYTLDSSRRVDVKL